MRSPIRSAAPLILALCASLAPGAVVRAAPETKPAAKADAPKLTSRLPAKLGDSLAAATPARSAARLDDAARSRFLVADEASRLYRDADGAAYSVEVTRTRTPAAAYALLTATAERLRAGGAQPAAVTDLGAYGYATPSEVFFARGSDFVRVGVTNNTVVTQTAETNAGGADPLAAARALDSSLAEESDGTDFPVLVRHLPEWEQTQPRAVYAVTLDGVRDLLGARPVLDGYDFGGGTEAVVAPYGPSTRLLLVEHLTPQLAADNDRLVTNRINELRARGAQVPAYRRTGNYLVFAFDAPDQAAGDELIGRVKYEQDVRWLGEDPFARQRAERAYTMMSLGVLIASLKSAGLGILLCLGVGGVFGSIIFLRRRAQSTAAATYSDAGGMVRLGIDDLTAPKDSARLLRPGEN